jgi:hypothetical protein
MKKKTVTLEFKNYLVKGIVHCINWDGSEGFVDMKPYYVNSLDIEEILSGVNDNGFGCMYINSVDIQMYECYEGFTEYLVPHTTFSIAKLPNGYGKRGV